MGFRLLALNEAQSQHEKRKGNPDIAEPTWQWALGKEAAVLRSDASRDDEIFESLLLEAELRDNSLQVCVLLLELLQARCLMLLKSTVFPFPLVIRLGRDLQILTAL